MKRTTIVLIGLVVFAGLLAPASQAAGPQTEQPKIVFESWAYTDIFGVQKDETGLWLVNEDGTGLTALTTDPAYEGNPAWSPDRSKIAFDANPFGNDDIFVVNADGTGQKRLTRSKVREQWATWSPDGREIAYAKGTQLWVMRSDGSGKRKLYTARENIWVSDWSPDGRWLAFTVGTCFCPKQDIFVVHPDGTRLKKLIASEYSEGHLTWSPDGQTVLFHRNFGCSIAACNFEIMSANARGKRERNITNTPNNGEADPAWSPDGTKIVYSDDDRTGGWGSEIYVMDRDGTNPRRLAAKPESLDYSPDW